MDLLHSICTSEKIHYCTGLYNVFILLTSMQNYTADIRFKSNCCLFHICWYSRKKCGIEEICLPLYKIFDHFPDAISKIILLSLFVFPIQPFWQICFPYDIFVICYQCKYFFNFETPIIDRPDQLRI